MRRVAAALQASPGALYAHVRDKAELDDLMIGELCSRVALPVPDPARWKAQAIDESQLQAAAQRSPLLADACRNTTAMLTSLLHGLGFRRATVTFASKLNPS